MSFSKERRRENPLPNSTGYSIPGPVSDHSLSSNTSKWSTCPHRAAPQLLTPFASRA